MLASFAIILILSIAYGYLNGLHGSASVVATIISSRAMGPRSALLLAAIGIAIGPFAMGVAVASTIAVDFVSPQAVTPHVVVSALVGAILWSSFTLWARIPTSISQSLIGGIIGAGWAGFGPESIQVSGLYKVLAGLFLSPVLGLFVAYFMVRLIYFATQWADPHINRWFNRGQILVGLFMAISFGANDGQKIIAMMTLGLVATGILPHFAVPEWVVALSALAIGAGTLAGGWRLIKMLGGKFYRIRPIHGFGAQISSAGIIFVAGLLGGPVSGAQVVTSSILGAGSADRLQKVRWGVVQQILLGWLLTLPFSALITVIVYRLLEGVML
ncbi:MAG: inorganic phosphate transporter [Anaerolineaceae bacterium]|nr:inorganic phosphate transporter [Anaerolineaceae bacterium]